jgi:hypothetical protein
MQKKSEFGFTVVDKDEEEREGGGELGMIICGLGGV